MPASTTAASQKIALNQPSVCTAPTTEPALNNAQAPVWTATSAFSPMACIPTRSAAARQGRSGVTMSDPPVAVRRVGDADHGVPRAEGAVMAEYLIYFN